MNWRAAALRRVAVLLAVVTPGCSGPAPDGGSPDDGALALGQRYVDDPVFRRDALVGSLVNLDNTYARRRLARYNEEDWGALPLWNPELQAILINETTPSADVSRWATLDVDSVAWNEEAMVDLGRRAFFHYPLQFPPSLFRALGGPENAARYGFWVHEGVLAATAWAKVPTGEPRAAVTCATCHASVVADELIEGRNNPDLDLEGLAFDAYDGGGSAGASGGRPGRLDVTDDGIDNATAIPDLRSVRWQVNLHRAATLKNGLVALAVRIETLIITSLDESVRPPRKLTFALALYLHRLQPRAVRTSDASSARGEPLFRANCAGCHASPGFSGEAVPLATVGTDPTVGSSPDRFTGYYRVPSLRGVGDRRRLLAGGSVSDLREMLDPNRVAPGHPFGLALANSERADLLAYLETL